MKITLFWRDPAGWAENMTGKYYNYLFTQIMHVLVGILTTYLIAMSIGFRTSSIIFLCMIILPPIGYLYIIKRLLIELKKSKT